jgi:ABC-2 type transport system permease protein
MHGVSTCARLAGLLVAVLNGCGSGGIAADRVENAVKSTFSNLIHLQRSMLGVPPIEPSALRSYVTCHRVGPGADVRGAGNWRCTVAWSYPGSRGPLRDTYELSVTMDGCYTATADAAEGHIGGQTIKARDGASVANLLYAFDGCFDTT